MTPQEVILPLGNVDETGGVLKILEEEHEALLTEKDYTLTSQKSANVDKCVDILTSDGLSRNTAKKTTHRFLHAALGHSKEFFLLCAFASVRGPIGIFSKLRTGLDIERVLSWWDKVHHPPGLKTFSSQFAFKFSNLQTPGQPLNKRARTSVSLERSQNDQTSVHILSESLEECQSILKRLYPAHDIRSLLLLSRQELIALLDFSGSPSQASPTEFGTSLSFLSPSASATPVDRGADQQYQLIPDPAGPRSTIRNLQRQDLFNFLIRLGFDTLAIPENANKDNADEDDPTATLSLVILGWSDKPYVEIELRKDALTRLLDYVRILGKGPTLQNISAIQSRDLFNFLAEYKGGCNPLLIQTCPTDPGTLPFIPMTFGLSDIVEVKIILQRQILPDLIESIMGTYRGRCPGLVFT